MLLEIGIGGHSFMNGLCWEENETTGGSPLPAPQADNLS